MTMYASKALDTRRWAQTGKDPRQAGRPQEGPPTREDEQRYSQTSPHPARPPTVDSRST